MLERWSAKAITEDEKRYIEDEDEDSVNVGAVNFRSKKKFQGGAKPNNQGGQLKCSYCKKTGIRFT